MDGGEYLLGARFFEKKIEQFLGLNEEDIGAVFHLFSGSAGWYGGLMFTLRDWPEHPYKILKKMFRIMDGETE